MTPNINTVNPPMTETISNANAAASTLFLGHSGEWWDFWLIISVIAAAFIATAIGVTTAGSIISHKGEAAAAEGAFNRYKLSTEQKISDANARAAEAQLALEKFKAPRSISVELRNRIVEQMKQFAPQEYTGRVAPGSDDAWDLWREISLALELAGWKRVGPFPPVGQPPYGPPATQAPAAMPGLLIWYPALNPTAWNDIRPRAEALAKAIRDGGNGVLAAAGPAADSSSMITIEIGPNPHLPATAYNGPD